MRDRYDLLTLCRNVGGDGGLSLVTDAFFDWGRKAMLRVAKAMTPDDLRKKGDVAFDSGKRVVLHDPSLRSRFVLICARRGVDREVADRVFVGVVDNARNTRVRKAGWYTCPGPSNHKCKYPSEACAHSTHMHGIARLLCHRSMGPRRQSMNGALVIE